MGQFTCCGHDGTSDGLTQAWQPDGDVTVIVAYKAGSGTDTGARLLSMQAEKYVGKTLVINNLPGADGKIQLDRTHEGEA